MRPAMLACRSYYSLLRGCLSPQRLVQKAKDLGYGAIALADVNSMYGLVDFCQAAEKANIRPIVGAEILTDTQNIILLLEDRTGYKNLCRILTAKNLDAQFDLLEQLKRNSAHLLCICTQPKLLTELKAIFRRDYLFVGCRDAGEAEWAVANRLNPIAYTACNIIDDEDVPIAKLLNRIRRLSVAGPGPEETCGLNKLKCEEQLREQFRTCPRAIYNAEQLMTRCNFQPINGHYFLPKVKLPKGRNADAQLARLAHLGLAEKYKPATRDVVKRLESELAVIRKNSFSDYFLVVYTIVSFAKEHQIPVEIRGSAAGSLVAFCLGFTRVCPIENKLYFERFMNPGRSDCPDIDIDLCWRRRDEVISFCYENWGTNNVAMICNISRYRRRSAVRDAARALDIPPNQINELVNKPDVHRGSAVYKLAEKIIGIPRHIGVHCGGIVITPHPIGGLAPLQWANKGVIVTQYDKDAAEALGLIKIDLLGNRALSTVNEAVRFVNNPHQSLNIDAVNPIDETTAKMLSAGDSLGVFQCESPGMRQLLRAIKVKGKKDVAIALSLIRPGPASGGMKAEFIERYVGGKSFEYIHPKLAEVLGDTYGVMLYQEDVMRIAVETAGYSIAEADKFRSEVSKKVPTVRLQKQYEDFIYRRANDMGIDRDAAEAIWEQILRFAAYSYCKAHATVYANIAWQTAYLKAHYPRQFYCSLLNNHQGMYPLRVYVWDAIRHGIKILPPHVNKGAAEWSLEDIAIRAGLNIIKGLGQSTIKSIIEQRNRKPFTDIDDLRRRVNFKRPELQNLIHVGACDGLGQTRPQMLSQLHHPPADNRQLLLFDLDKSAPAQRRPDYDRIAKLRAEIDVTGIPFTMHPAVLLRTRHIPAARLANFLGRDVTVAGFIAAARTARTNDDKIMGFVTLEDSSGLTEVTFFPDQLARYRAVSSFPGPIRVTGKVTNHLSSINVECRQACPAE